MALKTLILDVNGADLTPAVGTRLRWKFDRDVALTGGGVVPGNRTLNMVTIQDGGDYPQILVYPSDDSALQSWSRGYRILITAEPTSNSSSVGGYWEISVTSSDPATLNLSSKGPASPLPPGVLSFDQFFDEFQATKSQASSAVSTANSATNTANSAKADAAQALALAQTTIAPTDNQVQALVNNNGSNTSTALNDVVKSRTRGSTAGLTPNTTLLQRIRGHSGAKATEFGCYGDGSHGDAAAMQAIMNQCASDGVKLLLDSNVFALESGIVIPSGLVIATVGGTTTRFGRSSGPAGMAGSGFGTVAFKWAAGADVGSTMIRIGSASDGSNPQMAGGVRIEGAVSISGSPYATGTNPLVWVDGSFELHMDLLRVISHGGGVALNLSGLQNSHVGKVFIDNCGSPTGDKAAVVIDSASTAAVSNTLTIDKMHIERCAWAALDVGWGTDTTKSYAEFTKIKDLHLEAPDDPNVGTPAPPDVPLIRVGTITSLSIHDPTWYQGNGGSNRFLLRHNQQWTRQVSGQNAPGSAGFISIFGGTFLGASYPGNLSVPGSSNGTAKTATAYALDLVAGAGCHVYGTDVMRVTTAVAKVAAGYGSDTQILHRSAPKIPAYDDARDPNDVTSQIAQVKSKTSRSASSVTINSTSFVSVIPSGTWRFNRAGTFKLRLVADLTYSTANDTLVFALFVGGSQYTYPGSLVYQSGATGRTTVSRTWTYNVPAAGLANTTFEIQAQRYTGSGSHTVNAPVYLEATFEAKP